MSIAENAVLNAGLLAAIARGPFLGARALREAAAAIVARQSVKAGTLESPASSLSGGNVQRLILGRQMASGPGVVVAANPTRGLDIAASKAVHATFAAARAGGGAVLLIASDLDEMIDHCDRIAVLYRGRLGQPLERPFPIERIGAMLAGAGADATAGPAEGTAS